ncbi:MAG: hypothetical protein QM831_39380 [Kofleriaceae bacterium]
MLKHVVLIALFASACGNKKTDDKPAAKAVETAPAAAPAAAPAPAPAADANVDVDLAPGGDKWKGFSIKAPAGTTVADNGAGGVSITTPKLGFEMTHELHIKDMKDGVKSGLELSKGTVTYAVDKPDEIAYETETPAGDGKVKGYGFAYYVTAGGAKVGCSGMVDSPDQVAQIKGWCNSLAKK